MRAGATAADQGLELRNVRRGVLYGLASAAPIVATAAAGLLLAPTRGLYAAERATAADVPYSMSSGCATTHRTR